MKIREKIITRTIGEKVATLAVYDRDKKTVGTCEVKMPDSIPDEKIIDFVKQYYRFDGNITPVDVENIVVNEKLYGMPESTFLKYATELPPRATQNAEE